MEIRWSVDGTPYFTDSITIRYVSPSYLDIYLAE